MFLIAPAMEAPLVAHRSDPPKPIKTWVGNASWYGPEFDGKKTADGEKFDSESLTAAHPVLPFGSVVRIVNPRTGKFEIVRIMIVVPIRKAAKLMYPIVSPGRLD